MLVTERMSKNPVTVSPTTTVSEALKLMRERHVRRLPVLDEKGKLIGIVSEKDLLYASPSPATTLSVFEIHSLLAKITVRDVMTSKVVTIDHTCTLEEAARIMVDNRIGGLPVTQDDKLVGIVTETDLFKAFLELLGGREHGVRLSIVVPEQKGMLCRLTEAISGVGGNIISLGTFLGDDPTNRQITMKVADVDKDVLVAAIQGLSLETMDVREA